MSIRPVSRDDNPGLKDLTEGRCVRCVVGLLLDLFTTHRHTSLLTAGQVLQHYCVVHQIRCVGQRQDSTYQNCYLHTITRHQTRKKMRQNPWHTHTRSGGSSRSKYFRDCCSTTRLSFVFIAKPHLQPEGWSISA